MFWGARCGKTARRVLFGAGSTRVKPRLPSTNHNIDHELLMRAVRKHIREPWVLMYIERWLKAPFVDSEGCRIERKSGTPQGGVISPVLANLFMHYAFDTWMVRTNPQAPFE